MKVSQNVTNNITGILPTAPSTPTYPIPASLSGSILDIAATGSTISYTYAPAGAVLPLGAGAPGPANAANLQNGTILLDIDMSHFLNQFILWPSNDATISLSMTLYSNGVTDLSGISPIDKIYLDNQ